MEVLRSLGMLVLVLWVAVGTGDITVSSAETTFCNMTPEGLNECRPSATAPTPADPTGACCAALQQADLPCLCSYRHSLLLPSFGIDPDLAMQLPKKCNLTPPAQC